MNRMGGGGGGESPMAKKMNGKRKASGYSFNSYFPQNTPLERGTPFSP